MTDIQPPSKYRSPRYRSRQERDIATLLDGYGLPFVYEKPTAVVDSGKTKIWYPDFTLSYGTIIEYFGINGSQGYRDRTRHKLRVYEENQLTVLPVYPSNLAQRGWHQNLLRRIDTTLERQLSDYRGRIRPGPCRATPSYTKRSGY